MNKPPGPDPDNNEHQQYLSEYDDALLQLLGRNIENLKREVALGTRVDAASIRDLEEQYRKLSADINRNSTPRHALGKR
jgi:hypothetical protein